jgi:hypothetical protein
MLLRHATPARNVAGILRAGLLTAKSRGRLAAVWLCSPVVVACLAPVLGLVSMASPCCPGPSATLMRLRNV